MQKALLLPKEGNSQDEPPTVDRAAVPDFVLAHVDGLTVGCFAQMSPGCSSVHDPPFYRSDIFLIH